MESVTEKLPGALGLDNNEYDNNEGSPSSSPTTITNLKELVHEHDDFDRFLPADLDDHAADDEHPICMPSEMDDEDVRVAMVSRVFLLSPPSSAGATFFSPQRGDFLVLSHQATAPAPTYTTSHSSFPIPRSPNT